MQPILTCLLLLAAVFSSFSPFCVRVFCINFTHGWFSHPLGINSSWNWAWVHSDVAGEERVSNRGRKKKTEVHVCHVCLLGFINSTPSSSLHYMHTHTYTHSCTQTHTHTSSFDHTHACSHRLLNSVERQVDKQSILPPIQSSPLETGCYPWQQHFAADTYWM